MCDIQITSQIPSAGALDPALTGPLSWPYTPRAPSSPTSEVTVRTILCALLASLLLACPPAEEPSDPVEPESGAEATQGEEGSDEAEPEAADSEEEAAVEEEPPAEDVPAEDAPTDTFADGEYTSFYFNIRFQLPPGWDLVDSRSEGTDARAPRAGEMMPNPPPYFLEADGMRMPVQLGSDGPMGLQRSYDSLTFIGPPSSGLYMVIANADSVSLAATNFENLDSTVGFTNVRFDTEASALRQLHGVPAYFIEGDALETGGEVPVAFMAMALDVPGAPVHVTLFIPFDLYAQCYDDGTRGEAPVGAGCGAEGYNSDVMRAVLDSIEVVDMQRQRTR